jgi:hypothetical protein
MRAGSDGLVGGYQWRGVLAGRQGPPSDPLRWGHYLWLGYYMAWNTSALTLDPPLGFPLRKQPAEGVQRFGVAFSKPYIVDPATLLHRIVVPANHPNFA